MTMVSPMRISLRAISSMLCSEALLTINTADGDRFKARHRCQRPGAANLGDYVENACRRLARFKLVRDGPARRAGDLSQPFLQLRAIHFDDQAIDLVRQGVALGFHLLAVSQ